MKHKASRIELLRKLLPYGVRVQTELGPADLLDVKIPDKIDIYGLQRADIVKARLRPGVERWYNWDEATQMKPLLYPPVFLHKLLNGEIPIVTIAKLALGFEGHPEIYWKKLSIEVGEDYTNLEVPGPATLNDPGGDYDVTIYHKDYSIATYHGSAANQSGIEEAFRRLHFSFGLTEDQYIMKQYPGEITAPRGKFNV